MDKEERKELDNRRYSESVSDWYFFTKTPWWEYEPSEEELIAWWKSNKERFEKQKESKK